MNQRACYFEVCPRYTMQSCLQLGPLYSCWKGPAQSAHFTVSGAAEPSSTTTLLSRLWNTWRRNTLIDWGYVLLLWLRESGTYLSSLSWIRYTNSRTAWPLVKVGTRIIEVSEVEVWSWSWRHLLVTPCTQNLMFDQMEMLGCFFPLDRWIHKECRYFYRLSVGSCRFNFLAEICEGDVDLKSHGSWEGVLPS